jgi:hypothetical protein
MDLSTPENGPGFVTLAQALNLCRHGHEVRHLTAEETAGHWIVWGHYACHACRRVALDAMSYEPKEATIAGRRLAIGKR